MTENRVTILEGDDPPRAPWRPSRVGLLTAGVVILGGAALALFGFSDGSDRIPEAQPSPVVTTTRPTTTTLSPETLIALEYEADVALIDQLWKDETNAWTGGFDSGLQFWVDNNYPEMGCNIDDYMTSRFAEGRIEGLLIRRTTDLPTIEIDEGWIIPGGRLEGVPAKGRVYIMAVTDNLSAPGYLSAPPNTRDLHVTILDEQAHFFFGCSV